LPAADGDLAFFLLKISQVLYVEIEKTRADFADSLNDVGAGANRVANVNAAADAWVESFDRFQDIERRRPKFIFGAVIVNRDADVVFLYEFFDARKSRGRGITGDDYLDASAFRILKLFADVIVFVFVEVDGSGGVEFDASSGVIGKRGGFRLRVNRQVIFCVLEIYVRDAELFEKANQLRTGKGAKSVARDSKLKLGASCRRPRTH